MSIADLVNDASYTEPLFRVTVFVLMCALMLAWESRRPRRESSRPKTLRWINNFSLSAINTVIVRIGFPVTAYGVALHAQINQWGLFNNLLASSWLAVLLSVVLLDLAIYLQHRLFHYVPVLWRLHRMHHSDVDFDTSTGIRFHPIEIMLSVVIKMTVIVALGAPPIAVVIFEIALNATSLFNHGNVRIPSRLDRTLRWFIVTPDMHRVHHSVDMTESNTNFGFNLPWWDYWLATYQDQPASGHRHMRIGLDDFRGPKDIYVPRLLWQPFRN